MRPVRTEKKKIFRSPGKYEKGAENGGNETGQIFFAESVKHKKKSD